MPTLTLPTVASFAASVLLQFLGLALLPATRGFTAPWQTAACILAFVSGITFSARLIHSGVELSMLTPFVTVALQLAAVAVGIMVYGETPSFARLCLIGLSAVIIGVAAKV